MILGTPAYMSPEQARGKRCRRAADVWAFGCVLYELLTAKRAFEGEDDTSTLARVLEREPDYALVSPAATPSLRRILQRCLAKNPKSRYRSVADVRLDLTEALGAPRHAIGLGRSPEAQMGYARGMVDSCGARGCGACVAGRATTRRGRRAGAASGVHCPVRRRDRRRGRALARRTLRGRRDPRQRSRRARSVRCDGTIRRRIRRRCDDAHGIARWSMDRLRRSNFEGAEAHSRRRRAADHDSAEHRRLVRDGVGPRTIRSSS